VGQESKKSTRSQEFDLFREVIREARVDAGMSQRQLSRLMGLHPTSGRKIEEGIRNLDVVEFVQLARALNRDPLELLEVFLKREAQIRDHMSDGG